MSGNTSELEKHHEQARRARSLFKDLQMPHIITFDMQKTLPLPHLHTNRVFYLCQLWMYNLRINLWEEGTAKRGSCEVGSCLLKFILKHCKNW